MHPSNRADRRYRDRGYAAHLVEDDASARLTIRRRGRIVGEIVVGIPGPGERAPLSFKVKRVRPDGFTAIDELESLD
jgi:hypothetical protein